jgi:Mrp family chromosome partitioning ATPase
VGHVTARALSPPDSRPVAAAPPLSVLKRRMASVTGKGGVGKSTVGAALALAATADRRTAVLCELGTRAQLACAFGRPAPRAGAEVELAGPEHRGRVGVSLIARCRLTREAPWRPVRPATAG